MSKHLVTICIATYNREKLLPKTVESVINQTYKNLEIIIVNDCSTDNTDDLMQKITKQDDRIKYIKQDINKGLANARNSAIFNASGKYFTFIDDDDLWNPTFVEEFVKLAEGYNEDWCFCCGSENKLGCPIPEMEGYLKDYIKQGFTPPVASQFYFTSTLKKINGYNPKIKSGVDHDLWLKLAFNKIKIKSLEKCLSIPNGNISEERMTTNYEKRVSGINNSLNIWQKDIEKNFSKAFFKHFKKSYRYYLYKKSFIGEVKKLNLIKSIYFFKKCPKKLYLIRKIITNTIKKTLIKLNVLKKEKTVTPLFFPYKK